MAHNIYSWLDNPSCSAPVGFNRRALLQHEIEAMGAFSHEIAGTVASQQLALARQDANYEQKADNRCWLDDDMRFANQHVQMAKSALREGLPKIRELSRKLSGPEIDGLTDAHDHAEFRYFARKLLEISRPMCQIATGKRDDKLMFAARAEIARFRESLDGGDFAIQFKISQEDVDLSRSTLIADCTEPSDKATEVLSAEAMADVQGLLSKLRASMFGR